MTTPPMSYSTPTGRRYRHPDTHESWPSVTSILSAALAKPALPRWSAKAAAEYATANWDTLTALGVDERVALIKGAPWREAGKAADMGTAVHDAIDAWCTNRDMPEWAPGVEPFMEQFVDFLEARDPQFVENEFTVINREVGYAGTADGLAVIGGKFTLLDVKTGKGVWPEAGLQLAALAHGEKILRPSGREEIPATVDVAAVLHIRPRSWALVPIQHLDGCWNAFCAAAEVAAWVRDIAPGVLGDRLRAPEAPEWTVVKAS